MEVILREDIKGLGYKNDIVAVKAGYGRNYLIFDVQYIGLGNKYKDYS